MDKLNLNIIIYPFVAIVSIFGIALNKERIVYKYLAFILTFLSMIRFDTGYDYYWYYAVSKYQYMYHPRIQGIYKDLEPGIQKIVDIARYYKHPQYFFAITGLITFGLIYYTIYRDSKSPLISLNFFMFSEMGLMFNQSFVMQACALAICFFSNRYLYNKQYYKYILLVVIAGIFFHNSALICLLFLFVPRKKIENKYWLILFIVSFIVFNGLIPILASKLFPQYLYLIVSSHKYGLTGKGVIKVSLILLFFIFTKNFKIKLPLLKIRRNYYIDFLENIYIVGCIFLINLVYSYGGHIPFRVGIYFIFLSLILVSYYTNFIYLDYRVKIKNCLIIVFNFLIIFGIVKTDYIYLDKQVSYNEEGKLVRRPNSYGFRVFINKTERDMHRYLPQQKRGSWK